MPYIWPYPRFLIWGLCVILGAVIQGIVTVRTGSFGVRLCLPVLSTVPIIAGMVLAAVTEDPAEIPFGAVYRGFAVALPGVFALIGTVLGFWIGNIVYTTRGSARKKE